MCVYIYIMYVCMYICIYIFIYIYIRLLVVLCNICLSLIIKKNRPTYIIQVRQALKRIKQRRSLQRGDNPSSSSNSQSAFVCFLIKLLIKIYQALGVLFL